MFRSRYKTFGVLAFVFMSLTGLLLVGNRAQNPAAAVRPADTVRRGMLQTDLKPFDLPELVGSADKIYRGTVISSTPSSVEVGGGRLSVVTYQFKVEESFQGSFSTVKGMQIAEMTMLGKAKAKSVGGAEQAKLLPDMPDFTIGETYLIFATRPSSAGLSTTVGLGQGSFRVGMIGKDETAINRFGNRGLFESGSGAVQNRSAAPAAAADDVVTSYTDLASRIRAEVQKLGRSQK